MQIPHSRWNEVRADELTSCGYQVLTQSVEAGVDLFVKEKKDSLFVHFQGHPEYGARTLLKEYRRDIKRFLRRERETYPTMPHGYFDTTASKLLSDFREKVISESTREPDDRIPRGRYCRRGARHLAVLGRERVSQLAAVFDIEEG